MILVCLNPTVNRSIRTKMKGQVTFTFFKYDLISKHRTDWTDARRAVPRLWIRSAEVRAGGGRR